MEALLAREPQALAHAIEVSCRTKAAIVAEDEREAGTRALLNLGHTFGHAIEAATGYGNWLHGEAVAAGMVMAARLSERLGWLEASATERIRRLLERARLPVQPPRQMQVEDFLARMAVDKKVVDSGLRLVLLRGIGDAVLTQAFTSDQLAATIEEALAA